MKQLGSSLPVVQNISAVMVIKSFSKFSKDFFMTWWKPLSTFKDIFAWAQNINITDCVLKTPFLPVLYHCSWLTKTLDNNVQKVLKVWHSTASTCISFHVYDRQ